MAFRSEPPRARRVVLVTGASAGIGLATAKALIRTSDYRVVVTARAESLDRFRRAGIVETETTLVRRLDVKEEGQQKEVIGEIEQRWGGVDVLINNAGVAYRGVIEHFTEQDLREQLAVNLHGPLALTRLVLPGMRRRRYGRIVNVSSLAGLMAMPAMGLYSASKFALEGASESLWYEVRSWNIAVSLVECGFVQSDSFRNTRYVATRPRGFLADPYDGLYRGMANLIERLMSVSPRIPDDIARSIVRLVQHRNPPLRLLVTPDGHLLAWLRRVLPARLYLWALHAVLLHVCGWRQRSRGSSAVNADEP